MLRIPGTESPHLEVYVGPLFLAGEFETSSVPPFHLRQLTVTEICSQHSLQFTTFSSLHTLTSLTFPLDDDSFDCPTDLSSYHNLATLCIFVDTSRRVTDRRYITSFDVPLVSRRLLQLLSTTSTLPIQNLCLTSSILEKDITKGLKTKNRRVMDAEGFTWPAQRTYTNQLDLVLYASAVSRPYETFAIPEDMPEGTVWHRLVASTSDLTTEDSFKAVEAVREHGLKIGIKEYDSRPTSMFEREWDEDSGESDGGMEE